MALAYLAQHVADSSRRAKLVAFIRDHWSAVDEADWFARLWPDASPDGPSLDLVTFPDRASIQDWARQPLFRPLGVPTG